MSRSKSENIGNGGKCELSVWTRAITANSEWPDKEEFFDVIYWARQAIGIIVGIGWGLIPLTGLVALLSFILVNAGVTYLYFSNFQQIDEEEFGGMWELIKEGFVTSIAGFLVTWIIIYSGWHFD
ncbi:Respirasome Complex Assembly Factor 1 [Anthophora quadrimaculata]